MPSIKQVNTITGPGLRSPGFKRSKLLSEEVTQLRMWAGQFVSDINRKLSEIATQRMTVTAVPKAGKTILFADYDMPNKGSAVYPVVPIAESGGFVKVTAKATTGFTITPYSDNETVHLFLF